MPQPVDTLPVHPTTACCASALSQLAGGQRYQNILDLGCGSGLLSAVALTLWSDAQLLAADIAPQAVADTQALLLQQAPQARPSVVRSDGFSHALISSTAPYDLIICNLLAQPLVQWSPLMRSHLSAGGVCVLSGIQAWLEAEVMTAYNAQGFALLARHFDAPWVTLTLQKTK